MSARQKTTGMMAAAAALVVALVVDPAAAQEQSSVESLADQFEYALLAGDYRVLPLTEDFTYTENGAQLDPWDGMWRTLTAVAGSNPELYPDLDYRVQLVDGDSVVRVVEVDENTVQGVMAYRLTARNGQIASVTVLPVREEFGGDRGGTITLLQPMLPFTMDGELVGPADPSFAVPTPYNAGYMASAVRGYFGVMGTDDWDPGELSVLRLAPDCVRTDNGTRSTGVEDTPVLDPAHPEFRPYALGCQEQLESGFFANYRLGSFDLVSDPARGLAIAFVRLDQQGTVLSFTRAGGAGSIAYPGPRGAVEDADTSEQFDGRILTNMITPMSVNGVFLFKFNEAGEISRIEAFYRGAPLGWSAIPD